MHPLFEKANSLTETIIAAAIEAHRDKGPGCLVETFLSLVQGYVKRKHDHQVRASSDAGNEPWAAASGRLRGGAQPARFHAAAADGLFDSAGLLEDDLSGAFGHSCRTWTPAR